ncbi:unnamed protein product [Caenorhabditis sp. 36 PRJEB53466]|nr:unnamed protein product [Caenorhabditis sp. 36 PRJEB53466]
MQLPLTLLLLLLGIFLLHTCTVSSAPLESASVKIDLIAKMNQIRAKWAKSNNVTNMWKLENDKDLEAKAKQIFKETGCDGMRPGDNYRAFPFLSDVYGDQYESVLFAALAELEKFAFKKGVQVLRNMELNTGFALELSNALQKKVGCTVGQCKGWHVDPRDDRRLPWSFSMFCIIGPQTRLLADDQPGPEFLWYGTEKGEPGTKCGEDGVGDEEGLCVAK